jgi:hypothetical protein
MKDADHAIITPAWTHSYESQRDFHRSSPGFAPGFERTGRTQVVGADAAPLRSAAQLNRIALAAVAITNLPIYA